MNSAANSAARSISRRWNNGNLAGQACHAFSVILIAGIYSGFNNVLTPIKRDSDRTGWSPFFPSFPLAQFAHDSYQLQGSGIKAAQIHSIRSSKSSLGAPKEKTGDGSNCGGNNPASSRPSGESGLRRGTFRLLVKSRGWGARTPDPLIKSEEKTLKNLNYMEFLAFCCPVL